MSHFASSSGQLGDVAGDAPSFIESKRLGDLSIALIGMTVDVVRHMDSHLGLDVAGGSRARPQSSLQRTNWYLALCIPFVVVVAPHAFESVHHLTRVLVRLRLLPTRHSISPEPRRQIVAASAL
jgi:hypothetical protein